MTSLNSNDVENAKLKNIKEIYRKMTLTELLTEENTVQRAYWRRIPSYFEDLVIRALHKELDKKLK